MPPRPTQNPVSSCQVDRPSSSPQAPPRTRACRPERRGPWTLDLHENYSATSSEAKRLLKNSRGDADGKLRAVRVGYTNCAERIPHQHPPPVSGCSVTCFDWAGVGERVRVPRAGQVLPCQAVFTSSLGVLQPNIQSRTEVLAPNPSCNRGQESAAAESGFARNPPMQHCPSERCFPVLG